LCYSSGNWIIYKRYAPKLELHTWEWGDRHRNPDIRKMLKKNRTECRIWGSHSGGYEEYHLLGYNAV
jgi:hypothetical protein